MFRGDLALMYLIELDSCSGELIAARLVPMRMRRFRLERASAADARWLCNLLNQLGKQFSTGCNLGERQQLDPNGDENDRTEAVAGIGDAGPRLAPLQTSAGVTALPATAVSAEFAQEALHF